MKKIKRIICLFRKHKVVSDTINSGGKLWCKRCGKVLRDKKVRDQIDEELEIRKSLEELINGI